MVMNGFCVHINITMNILRWINSYTWALGKEDKYGQINIFVILNNHKLYNENIYDCKKIYTLWMIICVAQLTNRFVISCLSCSSPFFKND